MGPARYHRLWAQVMESWTQVVVMKVMGYGHGWWAQHASTAPSPNYHDSEIAALGESGSHLPRCTDKSVRSTLR